MGFPYEQLTEDEAQAWLTYRAYMVCWHQQMADGHCFSAALRDGPESVVKGKFRRGQNIRWMFGCPLCLEGEKT